jgi:4-hydroxy-tetrahydrodipicolinate reductase
MSAPALHLAVVGAPGRMGQAIARLALGDPNIKIVGAVGGPNDAALGRDIGELVGLGTAGVEITADLASGLLGANVVIEFSTVQAAADVFHMAEKHGIAVVSGTTNLDERALAALDRAAKKVPALWAPNMSLGVQVLAEIVEFAARKLGLEFDVEIVETHHRRKVDSPSGTAIRLGRAVQAARSGLVEVRGRDGDVGARKSNEMGMHAVRGGDVIGDHTVHFIGDSERLELTHRASNRDLFARGALAAARFLVQKPPGRYTIRDVLNG